MEWLLPILPATVIAGVLLFLLKEGIEAVRRWRANSRKREAFRLLLARECELNHWAMTKLKEALTSIQEHFSIGVSFEYRIDRHSSGHISFVQLYDDGSLHSSRPLPDASTDVMKQTMLEIAALDRQLFKSVEAAYDSAISLRHVRESLIRQVESDDEFEAAFFESFPPYGLSELSDIQVDIGELYLQCTGEELTQFRVR